MSIAIESLKMRFETENLVKLKICSVSEKKIELRQWLRDSSVYPKSYSHEQALSFLHVPCDRQVEGRFNFKLADCTKGF